MISVNICSIYAHYLIFYGDMENSSVAFYDCTYKWYRTLNMLLNAAIGTEICIHFQAAGRKLACEYSHLSSLPAGLAFRERDVVSPHVSHVVAGASERRLNSQARRKYNLVELLQQKVHIHSFLRLFCVMQKRSLDVGFRPFLLD